MGYIRLKVCQKGAETVPWLGKPKKLQDMKRETTDERKQKVYEAYLDFMETIPEEHRKEYRRKSIYAEVSIRTGYAAGYVGKIIAEMSRKTSRSGYGLPR